MCVWEQQCCKVTAGLTLKDQQNSNSWACVQPGREKAIVAPSLCVVEKLAPHGTHSRTFLLQSKEKIIVRRPMGTN